MRYGVGKHKGHNGGVHVSNEHVGDETGKERERMFRDSLKENDRGGLRVKTDSELHTAIN